MNAPAFRSYGEVVAELRRLCAERRTGTLFIATADNEGGQLGLQNGVIVSVRFRRKTGMEAAHGLRNMAGARFTFTPDFLLAPPDMSLSSDAVLALLTDVRST